MPKKLYDTGRRFQGRPVLYERRERNRSTGENSARTMPTSEPQAGQVAWDIDGVTVYAGSRKAAVKKARKLKLMTTDEGKLDRIQGGAEEPQRQDTDLDDLPQG